MDEEVWKNIEKIMAKIKPFIALAILIFIVVSSVTLINHNKLQREVKESCGYERSDKVYCVCDKQIIAQIDIPGNPHYNESLDLSKSGALNLNGS